MRYRYRWLSLFVLLLATACTGVVGYGPTPTLPGFLQTRFPAATATPHPRLPLIAVSITDRSVSGALSRDEVGTPWPLPFYTHRSSRIGKNENASAVALAGKPPRRSSLGLCCSQRCLATRVQHQHNCWFSLTGNYHFIIVIVFYFSTRFHLGFYDEFGFSIPLLMGMTS
jgi:hypothetical protein